MIIISYLCRSASSPASLLVYCLIKKQKPKLNKTVGSILISFGVALAMYGGAPPTEQKGKLIYWCIGVTILLSTLITGAFTGLQQEILYTKYGKHPDEVKFANCFFFFIYNFVVEIQCFYR